MAPALTAAQRALTVAADHETAKALAESQEAARKAEERRERVQAKLRAALPLLNVWFPGVTWDKLDDGEGSHYSELVLTPRDGDDRLKIRVRRTRTYLDGPSDEIASWKLVLSVVERTHHGGYSHWDALPGGENVKSLLDVGQALRRKYAAGT